MATLPGNLIAGKYRIERVLGSGGMGLVLACTHTQLEQLVAIKIMRSQARRVFRDAADRFLREARAVVRLQGEHVARVLDVGSLDDGRPYLVMEYLDGMSLADLIKAHGPLSVVDAVDLCLQGCAAIAEAHEHDIIHRDIKPANLFLTRRPDGSPVLKVLDFGISRYRDDDESDDITDTGKGVGAVGSPAYMSPEQMRGVQFTDERSDIWSLGVVLYQLLCGLAPFRAGSAAEITAAVTMDDPQPPGEIAQWLPAGLEKIVLRCLAKKPEERYQSITELAEALTRYASDRGRALADSPHITVRWTVMPRAASHDDEDQGSYEESLATSTVKIEPPGRLDVTSVLNMRPDHSMPITEALAQSLGTSLHRPDASAGESATMLGSLSSPGRGRRSLAVFGLIAVAVVLAGLFGLTDLFDMAPPESHANGTQAEPATDPAASTDPSAPDRPALDGDGESPERSDSDATDDADGDSSASRASGASKKSTRADRKRRTSRRDRARSRAQRQEDRSRESETEESKTDSPTQSGTSTGKNQADPFGTPD